MKQIGVDSSQKVLQRKVGFIQNHPVMDANTLTY